MGQQKKPCSTCRSVSATWDKTESCGTTQIDALRPLLSHTIICAARITGAVPVGHYCPPQGWRRGSLRPRKSIPVSLSRRAFTGHGSLRRETKRYSLLLIGLLLNLHLWYHVPLPPSSPTFHKIRLCHGWTFSSPNPVALPLVLVSYPCGDQNTSRLVVRERRGSVTCLLGCPFPAGIFL